MPHHVKHAVRHQGCCPQIPPGGMLDTMSSALKLQPTYPYWLAGEPAAPNHDLEVRDKYSGEVATRVAMADAKAIDAAIAAAVAAAEPLRPPGPYPPHAL